MDPYYTACASAVAAISAVVCWTNHFVTALHGMQKRSSDENSICLSLRPAVRLSVRQRSGLWQKERKISPDFYNIRKIIYLSFLRKKWLVGGDPFYPSTWNCGLTDPRWRKIVDYEQIIARNASAVTPSDKKLINTNRKSTMRFPMSLRWSSYIVPKSPKGAEKRKTAVFPLKSHFAWRKSATKFFVCENCQRQSCRAFIGLTIHAKIIVGGGGCPLLSEIFCQTDRVGAKSPIFDLFSPAAPQQKNK